MARRIFEPQQPARKTPSCRRTDAHECSVRLQSPSALDLSTRPESSAKLVVHVRYRMMRLIVLELFAWSLVVLSSAALMWFVAPLVVAAIHFFNPATALHLDLSLPERCSTARADWFIVKRVMVGYLALCLLCLPVLASWFFAAYWFRSESRKFPPRWSVTLDESGHD